MTIIYSRTVTYQDVPEGHPTLSAHIVLTEEVTGFALVEEIWLDGDSTGKKLVKWTFGTSSSDLADAIEYAVAYVDQRKREYAAKAVAA